MLYIFYDNYTNVKVFRYYFNLGIICEVVYIKSIINEILNTHKKNLNLNFTFFLQYNYFALIMIFFRNSEKNPRINFLMNQ